MVAGNYIWWCCNCGQGPLGYNVTKQCIHCGDHVVCDSCTVEEMGYEEKALALLTPPSNAGPIRIPPHSLRPSSRGLHELPHERYDENTPPPFSHIALLGHGIATVDSIRMDLGRFKGEVFARKSIIVRGPQKRKVVDALLEESHIMARVPHPHVCPVVYTYELAKSGRILSFGIIMKVVAEMNLAEYFEEKERQMKDAGAGGRLPILNDCRKSLLQWSGCLVRALSFIHFHRVRHRDIKPANILINDGNVLISDFGISKHFQEDITTMTVTDPIRRGTPRYWAPEVASEWPERLPRTRLSDVWSMGCVLLEMATMMDSGFVIEYRESPLKYFENPDGILQRIASNVWSARSAGLDVICFAMLNPKAEHRLRSIELAMLLETSSIPNCEHHDCAFPPGIATAEFEAAVTKMCEISRKGFYRWIFINDWIEKSPELHGFLQSKYPGRAVQPGFRICEKDILRFRERSITHNKTEHNDMPANTLAQELTSAIEQECGQLNQPRAQNTNIATKRLRASSHAVRSRRLRFETGQLLILVFGILGAVLAGAFMIKQLGN